MKILLIVIHLILFKPTHQSKDSVNVRVLNDSKYFIKSYKLIANRTKFTYQDIPPHSYSKYIKLPYIYDSNQSELAYAVKGFLSRTYVIESVNYPIDHVGDKKFEKGSATLILDIKLAHKKSDIETHLKQE